MASLTDTVGATAVHICSACGGAPHLRGVMALPPGTVLKHWVVGGVLGKGAFGTVYDAHSLGDPAAPHVALKVVTLVGSGSSKLKKSSQSREAALLFKEYNLYSGA